MEVSQYVKLSHLSHFFVREMTHRGLKCVTLVPVCHLTDKKWLSFAYWLTLMFAV